jgi:hypothetical protein
MPIPREALDLENRTIGINGEPTLAAAYVILKEQWQSGDRDRELGLHLLFLAWYGLIEPAHLTGFTETEEEKRELDRVFTEVHAYFEPLINGDAEMLFTVGLAAHMFWYMFDDAPVWEERAERYRHLYRALLPDGIDPEIFSGRGAYGEYYAGQAAVPGGY